MRKPHVGTPLRPDPSVRTGLRLMRDASPKTFWALGVESIIEGLIPHLYTLATGLLLASMPAAIESGSLTSDSGKRVIWLTVAMAGIFATQTALATFANAYREGFRARFAAYRREHIMRSTLIPPGIGHLEDPNYLDALKLASTRDWPDPGAFVMGVYGYFTDRVTATGAVIIVAVAWKWWVALLLFVAWATAGHYLRIGQAEGYVEGRDLLRRSGYYHDIAYTPDAAKEVRIFGLRDWIDTQFHQQWLGVMTHVWRARRTRMQLRVGLVALILAANVIAFVLLGKDVTTGAISIATLLVVARSASLISAFATLNNHTIAISLGASCFPAMLDLRSKALEIEASTRVKSTTTSARRASSPTADPAKLPLHSIVFDHVAFGYPGRETPVYRDLCLDITAGTSLGIVGNNGAGKTTLIKLLARLYEPDAGRILVDGIDIREFDAIRWQRRVAAIFQDFVHYQLSAEDNVSFGGVELTKSANYTEQLQHVAELVGADDLIATFPHGWKTVLSRQYDNGIDISGGQWQRIALARALFAVQAGAGILVLDEPTANLDARAEVQLFDRFLEVTKGSTALLISHRFSTVRRANRIVVIDDGVVREEGTHDELIAHDGQYARAFGLQAGWYSA